MNKTRIEWCDYTWNPVKGYCPNNCSYCYAHRMYDRFGWDKRLRLDIKELSAPKTIQWPSDIFVGSMIDLYHPDIDTYWVADIIKYSQFTPQHTFITLTKCPEGYALYDFPKNWRLGTTIEHNGLEDRITELCLFTSVEHKIFVSFEPLLSDMKDTSFEIVDWVIIGGLTPKPVHENRWIDDIVKRADAKGIPVFIKDNAHYPEVRRDFPA